MKCTVACSRTRASRVLSILVVSLVTAPTSASARAEAVESSSEAEPFGDKFLLTLGLTPITFPFGASSPFFALPSVQGKLGVELLEGKLDLLAGVSYSLLERNGGSPSSGMLGGGAPIGYGNQEASTVRVALDVRYNFATPRAGEIVFSVHGGILGSRVASESSSLANDGTVNWSDSVNVQLGTRAGLGLEYLFTDALSIGAQFDTTYLHTFADFRGDDSAAPDTDEVDSSFELYLGFRL